MINLTQGSIKKRISEIKSIGNKGLLEIFDIMMQVKENGLWKDKTFYNDSGIFASDQDKWIKKPFYDYLYDMVKWTKEKYDNIDTILKLDNGRERYIMYGHENMVTYKNQTPADRKVLLKDIEEYIGRGNMVPDFNARKRVIWPKRKDINEKKSSKNITELMKTIRELKDIIKKKDKIIEKQGNEINNLKEENKSFRVLLKTQLNSKVEEN